MPPDEWLRVTLEDAKQVARALLAMFNAEAAEAADYSDPLSFNESDRDALATLGICW